MVFKKGDSSALGITSGGQVSIFPHNPPNVVIDTTNNVATVNGVTQFSDWTLGAIAPTAANVSVSGRVVTAEGRGIYNAEVVMFGASGQPRMARTNPFGYFRFDSVLSGATYTIAARHKQYEFDTQVLTVLDETTDIILIGTPR